MESNPKQQIKRLVEQAKSILLLCHHNPDGDAIGSALGLGSALRKLGKHVTIASSGSMPDNLKFLPGISDVQSSFESGGHFIITLDTSATDVDTLKYAKEGNKLNIVITPKSGKFTAQDVSTSEARSGMDLAIILDSSNLEMAGELYENNVDFFYETPVINIDHHVSNEHFGKVNLVDITATSTAEVVLSLIEVLEDKVPLMDEDIATCLLTGVVTDTGSFQNANTTPKGFSVSAQLLGAGARQQEIVKHIFKTHELSTLKLWGSILSNIQSDTEAPIVWSTIAKETFAQTGSDESAVGGVIDELLTSAPEADVVMLLKESDDMIRGSLRAVKHNVDVAKLAKLLGGGGHKQASGFKLRGMTLKQAEQKAIKTLRAALKDYPRSMEEMMKDGSES